MDEAARCSRMDLVHQGRLLVEGAPRALLAAFEDEAYEVTGGEREAVDAALARLPEVRAASPAGSRLRIDVARGGGGRVAAALSPLGAALLPAQPDFEDLFLSRLGAAGDAPAPPAGAEARGR
jgi:ABC-2 type transport system ATP-binding protein